MGRVRNMNQFREKWSVRSKLSSTTSEYTSESTISPASSTTSLMSGSAPPISKKRMTLLTQPKATIPNSVQSDTVPNRPMEPLRKSMSAIDAERYETLATWIQRSGIPVVHNVNIKDGVPADAFDEMYNSLDSMDTTLQSELSQLDLHPPAYIGFSDNHKATRRPSLIDYLVVIGPDVTDLVMTSNQTSKSTSSRLFEPSVAFAYPPECQFNAESIEQFCFPHGVTTGHTGVSNTCDEFFVLVLSGGGSNGQNVQYGCCLRQFIHVDIVNGKKVDTVIPVCYCIVATTPWVSLFRQILTYLAETHQKELDTFSSDDVLGSIVPNTLAHSIDLIVQSLIDVNLPPRGCEIDVTPPELSHHLRFTLCRPLSDLDTTESLTILLEWALPLLLSSLSVDKLVQVMGLLLVEMKVIVVSKAMPLLSAAILVFSSLIRPLSWAGPLITILPPSIHEYVEAPVPIICGLDTFPKWFTQTKGTAIVDVDNNSVLLHADDEAQAGALEAPGSCEVSKFLGAFIDRTKVWKADRVRRGFVVAGVVTRRIRHHIDELLMLCSRINPCNVYACMKQEQLSLSETLFLKSFMQSQMYQKYTDDLPHTTLHPTFPRVDCPIVDGVTESNANSSQPSLEKQASRSSNLCASIRALFEIAVVGVNESEYCDDKDRRNLENNEQPSSGSSQRNECEQSTGSTIGGAFEVESPNTKKSHWLKAYSLNPSDISAIDVVNELSHFIPVTPSEFAHSNTSSIPERKSPVIDVPFQSIFNRRPSLDNNQSSLEILQPDGIGDRRQMEYQTTKLSVIEDSRDEPENEVLHHSDQAAVSPQSTPDIHYSLVQGALRVMAAVKIQRIWRANALMRKHKQMNVKYEYAQKPARPDMKRLKSYETILKRGTNLLVQWRQEQVNVLVQLSEDCHHLTWRVKNHETSTTVSFAVADIQVIRASGGEITIQTKNGELRFLVPPSRSEVKAMAFFSGLHRLVTAGRVVPQGSTTSEIPQTSVPPETTRRVESIGNQLPSPIPEPKLVKRDTSFEDHLTCTGILVIKHGRVGKPHPKYLACDTKMERLFWVDPIITNSGYAFTPPGSTTLAFSVKVLSKRSDKYIRIDEIVKILYGKQTRVFHRSSAGRSNAQLCFSIVTSTRTLDIEAYTAEDYQMLCDGFQQLIRRSKSNSRRHSN